MNAGSILIASILLLPPAPTPLTPYRDKARPVLIFAPSFADARFQQQIRALVPHTSGLDERQVVILPFAERGSTWIRPSDTAVWPETHLDPARLRATYRILPGEFTVILVGKDGGEKHRWHEPVPYDTLRGLIDAMPMRQDEMRRQPPR